MFSINMLLFYKYNFTIQNMFSRLRFLKFRQCLLINSLISRKLSFDVLTKYFLKNTDIGHQNPTSYLTSRDFSHEKLTAFMLEVMCIAWYISEATLFYNNYITQNLSWIILNFKLELGKFEIDPTWDYMFKMFLEILDHFQ